MARPYSLYRRLYATSSIEVDEDLSILYMMVGYQSPTALIEGAILILWRLADLARLCQHESA